ncbi:hypothetical protein AMS68_003619 [Peltaster fructicola]|uniref:Zinc-ribbon 15 domain-containing protein n=1 Tax=Peltaster fructicola TaxID=286661 RepID=A0A6H0XTK4_9PEZI|nr:hypothetical protein AMS68_003619 [Peltaster fructicola]
MAFIFTCGTHTFSSLVKEYENVTVQCQHCGNFSAKVLKRWEWFTFCFVPIIPFSLKPYHDVSCHICQFHQDLKYRPDVQALANSRGGGQIPMQGQPQGWNGQQQYQQEQSHPQYQQQPQYQQYPQQQSPPGQGAHYK